MKVRHCICFFLCAIGGMSIWGAEEVAVSESRDVQHEFSVENGYTLHFENFIGTVSIEPSESGKLEALFHITATSGDKEKAKELVDGVQIQATVDTNKVKLSVDFPSSQTIFYYPGGGGKSLKKTLLQKMRTQMRYHGREMTVFSEPSPGALSITIDAHIRVPQGGSLVVDNLVGAVVVRGGVFSLNVDTITADATIEKVQGRVVVATSSGNITVNALDGDVQCMSGSGKIECTVSRGAISANSASGALALTACEFPNATLETGTGSITVSKSKGDINALSGSGKVHIDDQSSISTLKVRSGSGSIRMKGDFSGLEAGFIQTGTANITFASEPFPEALFEVSVGIGQIAIDVPGLKTKGHPLRKFQGSLHENPKGSVIIRAGSGNIKISTSTKKESASTHANAQKHEKTR